MVKVMSELKNIEHSKEGYKKDEEEFLESIKKTEEDWQKMRELPAESSGAKFEANAEPDDFITPDTSPEGIWIPEDFGFAAASSARFFFEKKNFELVPKQYNYWLCRKKIKNNKGNTEYLVKFFVKILPTDIEFAHIMLTKALE